MVKPGYGRMRRPCKSCGKMFTPSSRWSFTCEDCKAKSLERMKERNKKKKYLKEKK
jgi:uncharacterized OB-fold protein